MRRDRKVAQKKKVREVARSKARASAATGGRTAILKAARESPFGPAYMSRGWRDDALPARLVSVVLTRALPDGSFVPLVVLVDRTCLGVKNAFVSEPVSRAELARFADRVALAHREGGELVDAVLAQSVVFAAIDYAASLGFKPHRDFEPTLAGPRPQQLEPTPLARPQRPVYMPGPDDDVERIVESLRRAVGPTGFDVEIPGDDDDGDELTGDDSLDDEVLPDEAALREAIETWLAGLEDDLRLDVVGAFDAYAHAIHGKAPPPGQGRELPAEHATSLPLVWAAFFRPLEGGRTGLDLARASRAMAAYTEELAQIGRTRATLFDVLGLDSTLGVATCRDVLGGAVLRVRLQARVAKSVTRWMRFFGYLTPMADGTWYHPSALLGHPWLRNVAMEAFFARLNALLGEMGIAERVDPAAPDRGLVRFGALAHVLLHRLIAPNEEQAAAADRPLYAVNSDGDRFELHEARLRPTRARARAVLEALSAADDFVKEAGFGWTGEPRGTPVVAHERIASVEPQEDGSLKMVANSVARFQRLLSRLEALAGTKLEPKGLEVMRPWEHVPRAVAEETPDTQRIVFGAAVVEGDPVHALSSAVLHNARRALDDVVPALGGRPRDLVQSDEGRRRVERWLEEQELHGVPSSVVSSFLDLDEVRRELGLTPVLEA